MKGGLALADLGLEVKDACTAGSCSLATIAAADDGLQDGWTMGVGIAYAFSSRISARLEYAYYDFGAIAVVGTSGGSSYSWDQEVNFHAVTAGVSFMF
jgi:opacity protein-like surface antigen